MTEELKPCAHCGGTPAIMKGPGGDVWIKCTLCGIQTESHPNLKSVNEWNARHEPEALPEWVKEAIEKRIEKSREKQDKITRIGPSVEREFWYNRIDALKWVLSLRKPQCLNTT